MADEIRYKHNKLALEWDFAKKCWDAYPNELSVPKYKRWAVEKGKPDIVVDEKYISVMPVLRGGQSLMVVDHRNKDQSVVWWPFK